jgi:two-component system chemotaxis response regulator CheB
VYNQKLRSSRIVVIDDSATSRELLVNILLTEPGFEIVGTGKDGHDAVQLVHRLKPDIILIDLHMPRMDGLVATRQIMREAPLPLILVSGSIEHETEITAQARQAGALAVISKPAVNDPEGYAALIQTVRLMVDVPVIHHWGRLHGNESSTEAAPKSPYPFSTKNIRSLSEKLTHIDIIGIAASTGGPAALASLLNRLPETFPIPIVIVQHISNGFELGFADWLRKQVHLKVAIASQGDRLHPGWIFLAPDDYHIEINSRGTVTLSKDPPYKGLRPSANAMFKSLSKVYGSRCLGLILTGMGDDGVEGLAELHKMGGFVLAQDEQSCIVYGMPRAAVMGKVVDEVLSLEQMAIILENIPAVKSQKIITC